MRTLHGPPSRKRTLPRIALTRTCASPRFGGLAYARARASSACTSAAVASTVLWATENEETLARLAARAGDERFVLTDLSLRYAYAGLPVLHSRTPRLTCAWRQWRGRTPIGRPVGSTGLAGTPVPLSCDGDVYEFLRLPVPAYATALER